jgi:para-nitrobenzyl esterase
VQENISAFGGDPAKVTIAGQSAGGTACMTLVSMPAAAGLFRRAISMSGPIDAVGDLQQAEQMGFDFAAKLGIPSSRAALAAVPDDRLLEAQTSLLSGRGAGSAELTDAEAFAGRIGPRLLRLGPFVDGDLMPDKPLDAARAGRGAGIDVLAGTTEQELNMAAASMDGALDEETLVRALGKAGLSADQVAAYRQLADLAPAQFLGQVLTDRVFRWPTACLAEARCSTPGLTYLYEFRWPSPAMGGVLGSGHCVDVPFVFDVLDAERVADVLGAGAPPELARRMHGAWVDFVSNGSPGWPAYELDRRPTMLFDESSGVGDDPFGQQRHIWTAASQ